MLTEKVKVLRAGVFNGRSHRALPFANVGDVIDVAAGGYCASLIEDGWVEPYTAEEAPEAIEENESTPIEEVEESEEPVVADERDNLQLVKWVGGKAEEELNTAGIFTIKQIAEMSRDELLGILALNPSRAEEAIASAQKLTGG